MARPLHPFDAENIDRQQFAALSESEQREGMESWFLHHFREHRGDLILTDDRGRSITDDQGRSLAVNTEAHFANGELLSAFDGIVPRSIIMSLGDELSGRSVEWERVVPEAVDEDPYRTPDYPQGLTAEEVTALPEDEQRTFMEAWFRSHFEGPDVQTPYDQETKSYMWIWGGPYDPNDVLQRSFADVVSLEIIQDLAMSLRYEHDQWAPIPGPDDVEQFEEADTEATPDQTDGAEAVVRRDVLVRLEEVEKAIRQLAPAAPVYGGIGHNGPPEAVEGTFPLSRKEQHQALVVLAEIRQEAKTSTSDPRRIEESVGFFRSIASKIQAWATENFKITSNEFAKSFGSETGKHAAQVLKIIAVGAAAKISGLADALSAWLTHIHLPF